MTHPPHDPDDLDVASVRAAAGLATLERLAETGSTMALARAWAAERSVALPAAVVADRQTAGHGRRGASWWQSPGSLATSLVLDAAALGPLPAPTAPVTPLFSLACGVALAETVRGLVPEVEALVRWPNDVVAGGRKLAGILVETAPGGRIVIGIGVNTAGSSRDAPPRLERRVATIPDLAGRPLPRGRLLVALVPRLLRLLGETTRDSGVLVERYRVLCSLTGTTVTVHREDGRRLTGPCLGIDGTGALVVDSVLGRVHLVSGSLTDPAEVWRGADDGAVS